MELRLRFLLVAALVCTACATTTPPLATSIDARIAAPPFDKAIWAVLVTDDAGRTLYEHNADTLMMPASNRKLYAAATIANCLGIDAQLPTEIWRDGEDLILKGNGDPSLGSWRYSREDDFDDLARALRAKNITRVRDVVVDVSAFDRVTIPGGWKHGNLGSDYAAPVDAITWGENELPGDRAVDDPATYAGNVLREALFLRGIEAAGVRVNTEPRAWAERIATIPSPYVGQLLATVLKNSQNLYTEMLFKRSSNGTYDASFERERALLTSEPHVAGDSFRFVDGCGLAPDDLVTARATVTLLRWMNNPVRRGFWWPTLAQPAAEGTLRRRLAGLTDRLRGKTGSINGVNALSGILAMPDGRFRYFSIMVNHHINDGDEAIKVIDAIVEEVAR